MSRVGGKQCEHARIIDTVAGEPGADHVRQVRVTHAHRIRVTVRSLQHFGCRPLADARNGTQRRDRLRPTATQLQRAFQGGRDCRDPTNGCHPLWADPGPVPLMIGDAAPPHPVRQHREPLGCGAGCRLAVLAHKLSPRTPSLDSGHFLFQHGGYRLLKHHVRTRQSQALTPPPDALQSCSSRVSACTGCKCGVEHTPVVTITQKLRRVRNTPPGARPPGGHVHAIWRGGGTPDDPQAQSRHALWGALPSPHFAPQAAQPVADEHGGVTATPPQRAEGGAQVEGACWHIFALRIRCRIAHALRLRPALRGLRCDRFSRHASRRAMMEHMRIGMLTSGGDAPGLNAVIRGAVLTGTTVLNHEFVGFTDGWKGLIDNTTTPLGRHEVKGISKQGGTILGTSRTDPFEGRGGIERVTEVFAENGLDALIAIGGEGTLAAAKRLTDAGIPIIGVPKTVDNDLDATDYTFGFDTAVGIATEAMDRLRTTGDSHNRCMVAEVMGRNVGWIALHSGMASGAHAILIPEQKTSTEQLYAWVQSAYDRGRAPLVVVAEGFTLVGSDEPHSERGLDAFGRRRLGGIGETLAPMIEEHTGIETRATTLGHIQRGGTPSAFDRVLATRLGMAAISAVDDKRWGEMVALHGTDIVRVPFEAALGKLKTVPQSRYDEAALLFG